MRPFGAAAYGRAREKIVAVSAAVIFSGSSFGERSSPGFGSAASMRSIAPRLPVL